MTHSFSDPSADKTHALNVKSNTDVVCELSAFLEANNEKMGFGNVDQRITLHRIEIIVLTTYDNNMKNWNTSGRLNTSCFDSPVNSNSQSDL